MLNAKTPVVVVVLLGGLGVFTCLTGELSQPRSISDQKLSLIFGSNSMQKGTKSYGCDDAAVTANPNSNYITASDCSAASKSDSSVQGKTCVTCNGPSTTSYSSDPTGTPLTYQNKVVDCSKSPSTGDPTTLSNGGTCMPNMARDSMSCQNAPLSAGLGVCPAGNFAYWVKQPVSTSPTNPP